MSGGQQQRVALARALVIRPSVLLLDEPLSNLDAKLREEMQLELRSLQRTIGTTTILVTHDQSEALALRDEFPAQRGIGRDLQLTTSRLRSWSQWKLHDPRSAQVDGNVEYNDAAAISLESVGDLVASSEIDFRTLRRDLHDLLDAQPRLSIAQALSQREAPQGLGSVIGYLSLGTRFGNVVAGEQELAQWRGGDGQVRRARIPLVWFTQERRHELA
ncbi:hypothetical protein G6F68_012218 [Rhizopus microsporus]|nr:hypothetical protein G6F68_012218 [Rhizopus microsporus]